MNDALIIHIPELLSSYGVWEWPIGLSDLNMCQSSSVHVHCLFQVEMYKNDPLVYHQALKAKWASEFISHTEIGRQRINAINIPALIFHGTQDHLVPFTSSEYIFNAITSTDKTFEVRCLYMYRMHLLLHLFFSIFKVTSMKCFMIRDKRGHVT